MHLTDAEDMALVNLYHAYRGGMSPGPLPFSGGSAEQPACVMDAFGIIADAEAKLKPKGGGEE